MLKIVASADCGNSPKKELLKRLTIALAERDIAFLVDHVTDPFVWNRIGGTRIQGKPDFVRELEQAATASASELAIRHIITHGHEGAVSGEITLSSGKRVAFCDVVEFSNAKGTQIKSITSYMIEIQK